MVTIRSATGDDVEEVLAFWTVATVEDSSTDDVAGVRALVEGAPGSLLLATDDAGEGKVIGTVIAGWDGWRGSMYRLAVAPEQRRKGIATALVREGERSLQRQGARRLHLIVGEGGAAAESFWTAAGYRPTGQKRFVKNLSGPTEAGGGR